MTSKVVMMDPKKLVPYKNNPRKNSKAIDEVAKSIKRDGFHQTVLVDQNLRICTGNTRTAAAIKVGLKKIPVLKRTMTEDVFIRINIEDNKLGELAEWDEDLLRECMSELSSYDVDLTEILGFELDEMESLLSGDDLVPEKKGKSKSKRSSDESTKLVFNCTAKQAMEIDQKLDGIIRERNLDNQVEALLFALSGFKGNPRIKHVRRS